MASYKPDLVPEEYDSQWLQEQLQRIALVLENLEVPWVYLTPQSVAPSRVWEGLVMFADGTNWNPGAGAGLYEYRGGAWNKL